MTSKRVDELEVGDIVIFPYCKGPSTIDFIKKIDGEPLRYGISREEVTSLGIYFDYEKVTYLGNKNMTDLAVKEFIMAPNSDFSGSRLISYEFGLVADFPINLPYSAPYYLKLVFKKGDRIMTDVWAARNQGFEYIPYLNKIVDRKEVDYTNFTNCVYYFTDGTLIEIT